MKCHVFLWFSVYSGNVKKPTEMTDFTHIHQYKERRRDKTPAHIIDVQSLMASVGESQLTSG